MEYQLDEPFLGPKIRPLAAAFLAEGSLVASIFD